MAQAYTRMINKMKVNIWVAVIVLLIGLWDLYTAYNRYQKKKMTKKDVKDNLVKGTIGALTTLPSSGKAGVISFTILGVVFTITGIILFFMI
ncbi:LPXTG cell wall anchor domain-containing protein [Lactobacillus johnsonii]